MAIVIWQQSANPSHWIIVNNKNDMYDRFNDLLH